MGSTVEFIIKITGILFLIIWGWETYAIKGGHLNRPSVYVERTATLAQKFFEKIGQFVAYISSFMFTWIDIVEMGQALLALVNSMAQFIMSPVWAIHGYIQEALSYGNKTALVIAGTVAIVGILSIVWYKSKYNRFI